MSEYELNFSDFAERADPFELFEEWLADATTSEINDPNAMSVATVDVSGRPNVRIVLLKGLDRQGFVFYTNYESAKGQELLGSRMAALCFHWKSLRRQVRVRGDIELVTNAEADEYYQSRPKGSRIGAWASRQSRPLESRAVLEKAVETVAAQYPGEDIPRPPHWSGFRLVPIEIEFWHDRAFRLHDRIVFKRDGDNWTKVRLYP